MFSRRLTGDDIKWQKACRRQLKKTIFVL